MPTGSHAVGFSEHPKLIDVTSDEIAHRWTEINRGRHQHSYRPLIGARRAASTPCHGSGGAGLGCSGFGLTE